MKIHHLNCASLNPFLTQKMICHCLLLETSEGLVLIDTGLGTKDILEPNKSFKLIRQWIRPKLDIEETAIHQIQKLGFSSQDVKHILLTHLDIDHAGGIRDFPNAQVHLFAPEFIAGMAPTTIAERLRYPKSLWSHQPNWKLHYLGEETWFSFECIFPIPQLEESLCLVPLIGHSLGHVGVAVKSGQKWLLHAGDSYFHRNEIHPHSPSCPAGLRFFQTLLETDREERLEAQQRLRDLKKDQASQIEIFCSHDPIEFNQITSSR